MPKIKICGITSHDDLKLAVQCGADAVGFIFHKASPRYVDPLKVAKWLSDIPPFICTVGVVVDWQQSELDALLAGCPLDYLQFHGQEPELLCRHYGRKVIKAFRVKDRNSLLEDFERYPLLKSFLLDAYKKGIPGGTGETFNWQLALEAKKKGNLILSGGLTPDNITLALETVQPYGVDVASGVEKRPGVKDPQAVKQFCLAFRRWQGKNQS